MANLLEDAKELYIRDFLDARHVGATKFHKEHSGYGYSRESKGNDGKSPGFFRRATDMIFEIELYKRLIENGDNLNNRIDEMEADIRTNLTALYNAMKAAENSSNSQRWSVRADSPDGGICLSYFSRVMGGEDSSLRKAIGATGRGYAREMARDLAAAIGRFHADDSSLFSDGRSWRDEPDTLTVVINKEEITRKAADFAVNGAGTKGLGLADYYLHMTRWFGESETGRYIPIMKDFAHLLRNSFNDEGAWSYGGGSDHGVYNHIPYNSWNTWGMVQMAKASMVDAGRSESDFRRSVFYDTAASYFSGVYNLDPENIPWGFYNGGWDKYAMVGSKTGTSKSSSQTFPSFALAVASVGTLAAKRMFADLYPHAKQSAEEEIAKNGLNKTGGDDDEKLVSNPKYHRLLEGYIVAFENGWDTV